jgi:hypothetical protein
MTASDHRQRLALRGDPHITLVPALGRQATFREIGLHVGGPQLRHLIDLMAVQLFARRLVVVPHGLATRCKKRVKIGLRVFQRLKEIPVAIEPK